MTRIGASLVWILPWVRTYSTISVSLVVPKVVSSSCFDGRPCRNVDVSVGLSRGERYVRGLLENLGQSGSNRRNLRIRRGR